MNKRKLGAIGAVILVLVAGAVWWFFLRATPAAAPDTDKAESTVSAQVSTRRVSKQPLSNLLTVFGDVGTGKVVTVSFPRAGQITQLAVQVGQRIPAGAPLATLSSDPAAQLAFNEAASALHLAQGELQRIQQLFGLQLATQSQVDTARKGLQDAQANLTTQQALGGDIGSATLRAPFDGVVVALSAAQGDRIAAGAAIVQLGHTDSLRVQLGIEPSQSRQVKLGMPVSLSPLQTPTQTVQGNITELQDLVDPKTQLVNAVVQLPLSAGRQLVPGMHVQGVIRIGQQDSWTVPRDAVLVDDKGAYLFQVDHAKARRVAVTKGTESGDTLAVDGPLDPALPVVVLGNYELQDGMAVREAAP